jgi:RHS repeat-associated protein
MFAATSGYRNDGDAGLMHVGARYYDAQVGRFVTRDTVLSEHPYIYCNADPVNAVDPTGHGPLKEWADFLAFWGGAGGGYMYLTDPKTPPGPGFGKGVAVVVIVAWALYMLDWLDEHIPPGHDERQEWIYKHYPGGLPEGG